MGRVHTPLPVQPFCALLMAPSVARDEVESVLSATFGPILLRSTPVPFTQTHYYAREMGENLLRLFVAFTPLVYMTDLARIKHTTNGLEEQWTTPQGHRRVNLDPGYLTLAKVVLASTKDHAHRLYLGAGIFAEVTLRYRHKTFQPWEWTYPDYRLPTTISFFNRLRDIYKQRLRQPPRPPEHAGSE